MTDGINDQAREIREAALQWLWRICVFGVVKNADQET